MISVNRLMTRDPFVFEETTTVEDATRRLLGSGLHGAVLVDASFRPLGVVSVVDLARALLERGGGEKLVSDIATRPAISVSPDDGVYEAVAIMVHNGVHRLAVVGSDGTLIGVVSPTDVLRGIVNLEGAFRATPRPTHASNE